MADNLTLKLVLNAKDGMSGIVRQAVRASDADFEKLQRSLKDTAAGFEDFGSKNSPKAIGDLTEGLYSIRSAGIDAANQFDVLRGSEKLAVAGLATTAEAVDIATSAINAFQHNVRYVL